MTNPFEEIATQLARIENLLREKEVWKPEPTLPASDKLLTVAQAGQLLNMTKGSMYGLVHQRKVPFCKRGKRLYFSEKELRAWIMSGRRQTIEEIEVEAIKSLGKDD
jgi:excisionase family DNA binding protein